MSFESRRSDKSNSDHRGGNRLGNRSLAGIRGKSMTIAVLALALSLLSISGVLESYGTDAIEEATVEATGIFLVARGINAAVSIAQSSTVEAGFVAGAAIQIGEALDPINDAVERLSTVMVWAIGSLLLQGVAIKLASSTLFQWGFAAFGLIMAVWILTSVWQARHGNRDGGVLPQYREILIRTFVLAAMIRFFAPAFVVSSILVGGLLLQDDIDVVQGNTELLAQSIGVETVSSTSVINDNDAQNGLVETELGQSGFLENIRYGISDFFDTSVETAANFTDSMPNVPAMMEAARELVENMTKLLAFMAFKTIVSPLLFLLLAIRGFFPLYRLLTATL